MASTKHFLDLSAVAAADLRLIMDDAKARKTSLKAGTADKPLAGKMLAVMAGDNVVRLLPPLVTTAEEAREGLARLEKAAEALSHR